MTHLARLQRIRNRKRRLDRLHRGPSRRGSDSYRHFGMNDRYRAKSNPLRHSQWRTGNIFVGCLPSFPEDKHRRFGLSVQLLHVDTE